MIHDGICSFPSQSRPLTTAHFIIIYRQMDPGNSIYRKLRSFSVQTTQEAWRFHVSSYTGVETEVASGEAQAPPEPEQQPAVRIS
uniref:Uncharacterized protein n=1 Tax=Arundo donax TaxID=35708 RepID=A0A0A9D087_ARUDO